MSTKFLVDPVLPGKLPPVSLSIFLAQSLLNWVRCSASRLLGGAVAVIHHYLTVKQCAIQSTNQAFALPCAVQWRGWLILTLSLSSPQAYDE